MVPLAQNFKYTEFLIFVSGFRNNPQNQGSVPDIHKLVEGYIQGLNRAS